MSKVRELALALLCGDREISQLAWERLQPMLLEESAENRDIVHAVEATDGSYYLPEGWDDVADATEKEQHNSSKWRLA